MCGVVVSPGCEILRTAWTSGWTFAEGAAEIRRKIGVDNGNGHGFEAVTALRVLMMVILIVLLGRKVLRDHPWVQWVQTHCRPA